MAPPTEGHGDLHCLRRRSAHRPALTIELVAPSAAHLVQASHHAAQSAAHLAKRGEAAAHLLVLIAGAVGGGLLFVFLDQLINERGGFLRKTATTIAFLSKLRRQREKEILARLSDMSLLHSVRAEHITDLVQAVRPQRFRDGEVIFREGDNGNCLYFIESGTVHIEHDGESFKEICAGEVIGEISLLTRSARTATARASQDVRTLRLSQLAFDDLRARSKELDDAARKIGLRTPR